MLSNEVVYILKKDPKYKNWKKRNDEKNFVRKLVSKIKKKQKRKSAMVVKKSNNKPSKEFYAPEVFSIIENPEETIKFLNDIIAQVESIRRNIKNNLGYIRLFSINMSNTKEITGDALMYLLTIIKNTRGNKFLPINWIGNFPKDDKMKTFLKNSGYLKYMNTSKENIIQTSENIQIQTGRGYECKNGNETIDIRQKIIDFTCQKLNKDKVQINYLMTMLTEMITNITDHAYDRGNLFEHSWYIFVENSDDKIAYTFMDNGLGIPTTIKKKVFEEFLKTFNVDKEYKYIEAAVSGLEKRSQTGLVERGNGLPSIYEQYTSNKISKLVIISNRAYFVQNNPIDLENNLNGTVFYWEIEKEKI